MKKIIASFLTTVVIFLGVTLLSWLLSTFPTVAGTIFVLLMFVAFWSGIYNMKE